MFQNYPDHECACQHCHPERFPDWDTPQDEGHVAIRWMTGAERISAEVYLDGEPLKDCDEAVAGVNGLVVRLRSHQCCPRPSGGSNDGYCRYVQHGHVRVVMQLSEL